MYVTLKTTLSGTLIKQILMTTDSTGEGNKGLIIIGLLTGHRIKSQISGDFQRQINLKMLFTCCSQEVS